MPSGREGTVPPWLLLAKFRIRSLYQFSDIILVLFQAGNRDLFSDHGEHAALSVQVMMRQCSPLFQLWKRVHGHNWAQMPRSGLRVQFQRVGGGGGGGHPWRFRKSSESKVYLLVVFQKFKIFDDIFTCNIFRSESASAQLWSQSNCPTDLVAIDGSE